MKIKNRPSYTREVTLAGLDEPLKIRFRRLPLTERMRHVDALRARLDALDAPPVAVADGVSVKAEPVMPSAEVIRRTLEIKADFLLAFIEGWEGVEDAEFSRDELIGLLDDCDDAYDAIAAAYRAGGTEAAVKNSSPSLASGPAAAAA